MAVASDQYSVTSGAAVLIASMPAGPFQGPVGAAVISNGAGGAVLLGGPNVSTANGLSLAASTTLSVTLYPGDSLYAVAASTTSVVSVLQT